MNVRLALAQVALLCACALPDLDTKGKIRCGTDGACPDGYQCHIGRCCPAGAALNACPTIPVGTPGAPCSSPTCPLIIEGRAVSGTCVTSSPGGYCTVTGCDTSMGSAACGSFASCLTFGSTTACVRRCVFDPDRPQPQPCRDLAGEVPSGETTRYVCIKDPSDRALNAGLCVPDCTVASGTCSAGTTCDQTRRTCVPADCVQNPSICGAGTTCDTGIRRCVPTNCRNTPGACEALGRSCDPSSGQCFRCRDLAMALCTVSRTCTFSGGACRPRCNPNPCPVDATCRGGVCSQ